MSGSSSGSYQYTTPTGSVLYSEVLSPYVYARVVELYPIWLHPNVVTLCGFLCVLTTGLLVGKYSPEFEGKCDETVYCVMAGLFAAYIIFDNTDGKQARRTKTSSNAGEVFDHGVDMSVATLSMIMVADALALGYKWTMLSIFFSQIATFMNNWYHKTTGVMSWGGRYFSVDEATAATCLTCLGAGLFGPSFYKKEIMEVPQLEVVGISSLNIGMIIVLMTGGYAVFDSVVKLAITSMAAVEKGIFFETVAALLPFIIYTALFFINIDGCVGENAKIQYALISGVVFSVIGTRLIFSMKFHTGLPAFIQNISMVISLLMFSCLGPVSPLGSSTQCTPSDGSIALRMLPTITGIHLLGFVSGLLTVSDGQALFTITKRD